MIIKKLIIPFMLFNLAWAESLDGIEDKLNGYVNQLQEHRKITEKPHIRYFEQDYFLCPGDFVESEMRAALFQAAKKTDQPFASFWQDKATLVWEDGSEKPEYNILNVIDGIKQDGTQGIALENIVIMPRGQIPKPKELEHKEKIKNTNNKNQLYRNLVTQYPKNCSITILNRNNLNWRQDTVNNVVALRRLKANKAEFEWRLPKENLTNTGYEIIALDKKGSRLELIGHEIIPLAVKKRLNKTATKIYPKAKAALKLLMQKDENNIWNEGEYHLINAEGEISDIYIKSYNGIAEAKASVAWDEIKGSPAYIYLGKNPFYSPSYYTLDEVKKNTKIITASEDSYIIELPASLNSAYVQMDENSQDLAWNGKLILSENIKKNKVINLQYPLEMKIDIFDETHEGIIFSEDQMTVTFNPLKLALDSNPKYYNVDDPLKLPYRLYDKKGFLLKPKILSNKVEACKASGICEVSITTDEPIAWIETAFPKSFEALTLKIP